MIKSIFSFGFLQGINFLTPILLIGIISRTENDSAIITYLMMQSVSILLAVTVEYGFYISAIRRLSVAKKNNDVATACTLVNASKFLIFILISIATLLYAVIFNKYTMEIYLGILLAVFSIGMRPLWYFQAFNNYKIMIKAELFGVAFALLIMVFITGKDLTGGSLFIASFLPRVIITIIFHCILPWRVPQILVSSI